jgi:hypothetical protein
MTATLPANSDLVKIPPVKAGISGYTLQLAAEQAVPELGNVSCKLTCYSCSV